MTWTPRDVVAVVLVLALAIAFVAVVVGAIVVGTVAESIASFVTTGFVLLLLLLAGVLGVHLRGD